MDQAAAPSSDEIEALKAALAAACARAETAERLLGEAQSNLALIQLQIDRLKLRIAQLRRDLYGPSAERTRRLIDELELELEELETGLGEAEAATPAPSPSSPAPRRKPVRKPFPAHSPRERVVLPAPCACPACGGARLSKIGEDVAETLEIVPRSFKLIQTVREKFSCRDCETISQPPAPFHAVPRGWAGPGFLALLLFEKFGRHQPLNRQAERFAREGLELSLSTLADQVGAAAAALAPLHEALEAHVFAAELLHGDDTTVPVLAKGKTETGRLWVYVRDDRPFGGVDPPAAVFRYSRDRKGEHPRAHLADWSGILQADAYGGYAELYAPDRKPGLIREAACFAHARRKFFELADLEGAARKRARGQNPTPVSPLALEALRRIDALFDIERDLNGKSPDERRAGRQERSKPIMQDLQLWMTNKREALSRHHPIAKAFSYMLTRWEFTAFLDDGRICLTNNAAERSLRPVALGRKAWLFAGSDKGGERAALLYSLIETAKLNGVDPQAWLAWVLGKIADHPAKRINELLPWSFQKNQP